MSEEKGTKRYQERVKPRLDEIKAWARDGLSEEGIAKQLEKIISFESNKQRGKKYHLNNCSNVQMINKKKTVKTQMAGDGKEELFAKGS